MIICSSILEERTQEFTEYLNLRLGRMMERKEVVIEQAEKPGIIVESYDIQKAHCMGRKRSLRTKPRPIIARFVKFKNRNNFLFSKSMLKDCNDEKFKNAFMIEDLTPLRSKLLIYV